MNVRENQTSEARRFMENLIKIRNKKEYYSGAFSLTPPEGGIDEYNDYFGYIQREWKKTPCVYGTCHTDVSAQKKYYDAGAVPLMHAGPHRAIELMDQYSIKTEKLYYDGVVHYDAENPDRDMRIYNHYLESLKRIADVFESMEECGIKVYMYRPFIEMNNSVHGGFFGMTEAGYASSRNVWRQMHHYLYDVRKLKGLLMVFAPAGFGESKMFYPGDEYVDIIAPTCYSESNTGALSEDAIVGYDWMLKTGKPLALSETSVRESYHIRAGKNPPGDWLLLLDSIHKYFPQISFAVSWFGFEYTMFPPNGSPYQGNLNGYKYITDSSVISADTVNIR